MALVAKDACVCIVPTDWHRIRLSVDSFELPVSICPFETNCLTHSCGFIAKGVTPSSPQQSSNSLC
jgi:hypothetical protein